jgi:hypothetical protein
MKSLSVLEQKEHFKEAEEARDNCHNPTNNPKQLKTIFVGVVLLSVKKPHHHHHTMSDVITF